MNLQMGGHTFGSAVLTPEIKSATLFKELPNAFLSALCGEHSLELPSADMACYKL